MFHRATFAKGSYKIPFLATQVIEEESKDRIGLMQLMENLSKISSEKDKKQIIKCLKLFNICLAKHLVLHRMTEGHFRQKQEVFEAIMKTKKENREMKAKMEANNIVPNKAPNFLKLDTVIVEKLNFKLKPVDP